MATLLYITANPQKVERSASLRVGKTFLEEYQKNNPMDTIEYLDLITEEYRDIDYVVMEAIQKQMEGLPFGELTGEEQEALLGRQRILNQFLTADKIVIVTPMWEYSFPAVVKKYLDTITLVGVTFKYTEEGVPVGLLKDLGKKALHIQASGGIHTAEVIEQAHANATTPLFYDNFGEKSLHAVFDFIGIELYTHLYIPGQALPTKEEFLTGAYEKARMIAKEF